LVVGTVLSSETSGVHESGNSILPLLTYSNNGSTDEADSQDGVTSSKTLRMQSTVVDQPSADEPVVIPDDRRDPPALEQDVLDTRVVGDTRDSTFHSIVNMSTSTDNEHFRFTINITTSNNSVETSVSTAEEDEETASRVTNTTGKFVCLFVCLFVKTHLAQSSKMRTVGHFIFR